MKVLGLSLLVLLFGCGNYSNADLEFMNAVPQTGDLSVTSPRLSAVRPAAQDDALRMTVDVTTKMNASAAGILALVDKLRTIYPTTRDANTRIWGPWPSDENPGWQLEFAMTRRLLDDGVTPHFDYELIMIPPAGVVIADGSKTTSQVLGGAFESTGLARAGVGRMWLLPKDARDAGAVLKDLEKLDTLTIDYDNRQWPRTLDMVIVNEPPLLPTDDAQSAQYGYRRSENGDGSMTFTFLKDAVAGPLGLETLSIASLWRGTGEGRADISIAAGDGAGTVGWTDCWDTQSETSYNSRNGTGAAATCIPLQIP
jgi:hypothetical protein